MYVIIHTAIIIREKYCFASNEILNIEIIQYLGYDWKKKQTFNTIKIQTIHRNPNQFFLKIILAKEIIKCIARTQKDKNNQTG